MKTTEMPASSCLACAHRFDRASDVISDNLPTPGDLSICIMCGAVAVFTDELTLRPVTEADIQKLPLDVLSSLQRSRRFVMENKKDWG